MLARSGEITEPCPVPRSLTVTTPFSMTPALSHLRIRRMIRRSPIRCSKNRMSHAVNELLGDDVAAEQALGRAGRRHSGAVGRRGAGIEVGRGRAIEVDARPSGLDVLDVLG